MSNRSPSMFSKHSSPPQSPPPTFSLEVCIAEATADALHAIRVLIPAGLMRLRALARGSKVSIESSSGFYPSAQELPQAESSKETENRSEGLGKDASPTAQRAAKRQRADEDPLSRVDNVHPRQGQYTRRHSSSFTGEQEGAALKLIEMLTPELHEMVLSSVTVRTWLQLPTRMPTSTRQTRASSPPTLTPCREAMRQLLLKDLLSAETAAFSILDSIQKYLAQRAKLCENARRAEEHTAADDRSHYRRALSALDDLQALHLKATLSDLSLNDTLLYDRITQFMEESQWTVPTIGDAH
ncbi:uncharacterized protein EV422DRAFT_363913 [Fimicolochytrium jonesii]|uniref:uncharacterized protein n=1 Tax=Fimicolochytrium jonesii TaxID=1396493 RepID=UPI0022FE07BE|nr:uncharacterized protein EV422DRAFT_363913 [Fimicolochytrium jonesii]KAI8823640.1 hypothetical protein EV422DRAFT_363913 [Fimicolochytrium jonesii]